jgi:L-lactate permease
MIVGSMATTASKPGGAEILTKMPAQAGGSYPPDTMSGFPGNPAAAGGSGMVNTLFGSRMGAIQNTISHKTGLPAAAVGKVLAIAAPMVTGSVGKMVVQQKMDAAGLTSLPKDQSMMALRSSPDAAAMVQQLAGTSPESTRGVAGILKKVPGT